MMKRKRSGFTLVELMVVVAIILLVALVAIPAMSTMNGRQVADAARIFTGGLVGARSSASERNKPRGIRLLPDPVLTLPAPGSSQLAGTTQLVYNRYIAIEPAGDYIQGVVNIGPQLNPTAATDQLAVFPPVYPRPTASGDRYPYYASGAGVSKVLMVEESPFVGGFVVGASPSLPQPNAPTNWYWTVRVGDKIRFTGSGRAYTIVGPLVVSPWGTTAATYGNPELFVNVGAPGTASPLERTYYYDNQAVATKIRPEFLYLVNSEDDDEDGYVDEGWDGFNNDAANNADDLLEWETEKWVGSLSENNLQDTAVGSTNSPSVDWITNSFQSGTRDASYTIVRRPIPSPGVREVMLPAGTVIDATTWNSTRERSRIPVSSGSLYCDIMVDSSGVYVPTTEYSSPTSAGAQPFLHFWLTDRGDVHPRGSVWGIDSSGVPNPNPNNTATKVYFELPMPTNALGLSGGIVTAPATDGGFYPGSVTSIPVLKGDRRLVTMFTQSGLVTTNSIESIPPVSAYHPGEGFNTDDVGYPFFRAQQGQRVEAR